MCVCVCVCIHCVCTLYYIIEFQIFAQKNYKVKFQYLEAVAVQLLVVVAAAGQ